MTLVGADTAQARKARGAFFTPPTLADFLTSWAVRKPGDRVLEPSCGDAAFLVAAGQRLRTLGLEGDTSDALHGVELHDDSATSARQRTAVAGTPATISVGDFFDHTSAVEYDAVIGNPPYVRYQDFAGHARARGQAASLAQGVRMSGLASSWAPFVVHAAGELRPGGRLALVLPAELLTVNYAAPVRAFLMKRFGTVRLVLFEERVFPGVIEEVVLLLAEGQGPTDSFTVHQVRDLEALATLDSIAPSWTPGRSGDKWSPALLPIDAAEHYQKLTRDGSFGPLEDWGDTYLGSVTGNNRYFALTVGDARERGFGETDVIRISPPGSRHLRGLTFTTAAWQEMVDTGARAWLFYPKNPGRLTRAARDYIAEGETNGVPDAYKCRVRTPWWRVPLVRTPHLLLTYMNHDTPRLVRNSADVRHLNSIHGVRLHHGRVQLGQDVLPVAALNTATLLGAEMVGRSYGGGILKLEPKEADVLPVPSHELVVASADKLRALRPQLGASLRGGKLIDAVEQVDRIVLVEGCTLKRADVRALREAREALFARRTARS